MSSGYEYYIVSVRHLFHKAGRRRFQLTAYTVAVNRFTVFLAYGKPYLGGNAVRLTVQHDKIFIRYTLGMLIHEVVLIVLF